MNAAQTTPERSTDEYGDVALGMESALPYLAAPPRFAAEPNLAARSTVETVMRDRVPALRINSNYGISYGLKIATGATFSY